MRILLTNDDGVRSPALRALHDALIDAKGVLGGPLKDPKTGKGCEVYTVAPATVQSATGHGITFSEPLMVEDTFLQGGEIPAIAVDARPADCVKLALSTLWPARFGEGARPDLVISGMNIGANVGVNVIYSGTVAAALEAAFLGVPSIAVSQHIGRRVALFDVAAAHARRTIDRIMDAGGLMAYECLNVNIPRCERALDPGERHDALRTYEQAEGPDHEVDPEVMPKISVCRMNTHGMVDGYEKRVSPAGHEYYWPTTGGLDFHDTEPGTDVDLMFRRHITITPLRFDLTRGASIDRWMDALG